MKFFSKIFKSSRKEKQQGKKPRWKKLFKILGILALGIFVLLSLALAGLYWYFSRDLPQIYSLKDYRPKIITEIYSDDGTLIAEFAEEYRKVVPLEKIPPYVKNAFLAIEDARFYEHEGLDFYRLLGALWHDIKVGRFEQGASTITMQLARTFFLSRKKVLTRKIKEMILAWRMDKYLSKDEILWLYLTQIYLGHNSYGVEAASERYFGKSVNQLTLAEAALLATLPRSPALYSPIYHFDRAKRRQKLVLRRMVEEEMITKEEAKLAEQEPIFIKLKTNPYWQDSAYFIEAVRRYLVKKYGKEKVLTDGLKVFTTMNTDLQRYATQAVKLGLAGANGLDHRQGYRGPIQKIKKDKWLEFLNEQEAKLMSRWKYRLLTQGFNPLQEIKRPTPLDGNEWYKGLIVKIDKKKKRLKIAVGKSWGWLYEEDCQWALAKPKEKKKPLDKVFHQGDVVWVSVIGKKESKKGTEYKFQLEQKPLVQAGLVAFSVRTGEIKALVGGYDFKESQLIRPLQSQRQPGSAFKPIIYASALAHPTKGYTPATIIYDTPIIFDYVVKTEEGEEERTWRPENYGGRFQGPKTFRRALEHSINTISVKILDDIGIDYVHKFARTLGIKSELANDLSLALGSSPVYLLELARAYNVFASGGYLVEPYLVRRIYDRDGNLLEYHHWQASGEQPGQEIKEMDLTQQQGETAQEEEVKISKPLNPKEIGEPTFEEYLKELKEGKIPSIAGLNHPVEGKEVLSPQIAYLMTNLLKGVIQRGTGWRAKVIGRPLAGKTGTTNEFRDAWFIGYSPTLICGVWVGFDNYTRSLGEYESGAKAALPIWISFMKNALKSQPVLDFPVPDGIEFALIDQKTGLLASSCSEDVVMEAFIAGTAPSEKTPCQPMPETMDLLRSLDR